MEISFELYGYDSGLIAMKCVSGSYILCSLIEGKNFGERCVVLWIFMDLMEELRFNGQMQPFIDVIQKALFDTTLIKGCIIGTEIIEIY